MDLVFAAGGSIASGTVVSFRAGKQKATEAVMFIRNQWYVASWDHEIDRAPFARTICGERIMVYRKLDGRVVGVHDACPLRLLPLSMGIKEGDNVRCRYHG